MSKDAVSWRNGQRLTRFSADLLHHDHAPEFLDRGTGQWEDGHVSGYLLSSKIEVGTCERFGGLALFDSLGFF